MKGWLEKSSAGHEGSGLRGRMGNTLKKWDRRYFVLRGHAITYYKLDADVQRGTPAGTFDCRGAKFERAPGSFVLTNKSRELTLRLLPLAVLAYYGLGAGWLEATRESSEFVHWIIVACVPLMLQSRSG